VPSQVTRKVRMSRSFERCETKTSSPLIGYRAIGRARPRVYARGPFHTSRGRSPPGTPAGASAAASIAVARHFLPGGTVEVPAIPTVVQDGRAAPEAQVASLGMDLVRVDATRLAGLQIERREPEILAGVATEVPEYTSSFAKYLRFGTT